MRIGIQTARRHLARTRKREFDVLRSGMMILPFASAGRNQLLHDVDQIDLHVLAAVVVEIMRTFLRDDGARGVMRIDDTDSVFNTGFLHDRLNPFRHVVKTRKVIVRLKFDFTMNDRHVLFLSLLT